jgi:hypothetical protein
VAFGLQLAPMMSLTSRAGFRSTTSGSGRATVWRVARVLLVGAGLAAVGLWLSSFIGAPTSAEPVASSLARDGFAPGFGVASAAIMVLVWTSSSRRVTEVQAVDAAAVVADGATSSRPITARAAEASRIAAARGRSAPCDVLQARSPRPERRSETGSRRVSWANPASGTGLRYAGVATSELRRPMFSPGR